MTWIIAAGLYNLAFALFHLAFWRLLNWKEQLPRLSPTNQAVMQALNLSLTFLLSLGAYLLLFYPEGIQSTGMGGAVAVGMLLFWIFRTGQQVLLFDLRSRVHQVLLAVFLVGILIHGAAILI